MEILLSFAGGLFVGVLLMHKLFCASEHDYRLQIDGLWEVNAQLHEQLNEANTILDLGSWTAIVREHHIDPTLLKN